ncbi:MAG: hypothetical protein LUE99_08280 [Bacteroides sp.]|nr:hypothetical protein [Bacteroides sp.]
MRRNILLHILALCTLIISCTNKPPKEAAIGSANDTVPVDTITDYELADCNLVYTEALPKDYSGAEVTIKTENKSYPADIGYLSVFVYNPTVFLLNLAETGSSKHGTEKNGKRPK